MKKQILFFIAILIGWQTGYSQPSKAETDDAVKAKENPDGWKMGGSESLTFNQVGLKNWSGGGSPSISFLGQINFTADYKMKNNLWQSRVAMEYGLQKVKDLPFRKNSDRLEVFTKYGYRVSKKWYVATYANIRTQFSPTFDYDADGNKARTISKFASPIFLEAAIGMDYIPNPYFSMFLSPIAGKVVIVSNDTIASYNPHGNNFKNFRGEFGATAMFTYNQEVVKNVTVLSVLKLYKDYLNGPAQNLDVDWQTTIGLKVTKYIAATVFTHLIWDYDVISLEDRNDNGILGDDRGIQFKDVIGVGFSYTLDKTIEKKQPAPGVAPIED